MSLRFNLRLATLTVVSTLILAGCQGLKSATPAPNTFQLTVTQPPANSGTITSAPAGISCPGTCAMSFAQGTAVTLTATPATNYTFGGWGGACTGTGTCSVTLNAAANVTDTFTANGGGGTDALTVTLAGTGTGTVTSGPAGINCSTAAGATCSANFPQGTTVTLTETPATGSVFTSWTGCTGTTSCSITLSAASNPVTATFTTQAAVNDSVTVTLAGTGTGTVTSAPAGINCSTAAGATCTAMFTPGTVVTLTEAPASNSVFTSWTGCTGTTSCSLTLSAATNPITATFTIPTLQSSINHIILFAQENRSLDHYFGAMQEYWSENGYGTNGQTFDGLPQFNNPPGPAPSIPGCNLADDATDCTPDPTNPITSFHFASVCEENQSPFWNEAHNDWDYTNPADQPAEIDANGNPNPPLNGFVFTAAYDARGDGFMDVNGVRAMGYYDGTDLNYYYFMASNFGTSDRQFSPLMDRTQVNRMYIYAATSEGHAYPIGGGLQQQGLNDDSPLTSTTIFETLQNAGINWRIYVDPTNTSYMNSSGQEVFCDTQPAGQVQDMCLAEVSYMNMFNYEQQIQNASTGLWQHFAPISQFATDIQDDATFPQFVLIEPASNAGLDEHPSDSDGSPVNVQAGAQYVENTIINPLMQSPSWTDSVLFFTYDEAGGLYDHVPPQPIAAPGGNPGDTVPPYSPFDLNPALEDICTKPGELLGVGTCDFAWTGYRVPFIAISPYSVKNYVSHTVRDTTAVLALVESRFGLPALTGRDGYYLSNTNMNEFFDFVNKPWATPPTPPAQSRSGSCNQTPPANWNEPPVLTVVVTGTGSVTSSPASPINKCSINCSATFPTGTVVTLTATPGTGSTFTGWSGGGCSGTSTCSITPTAAVTVTATFNP